MAEMYVAICLIPAMAVNPSIGRPSADYLPARAYHKAVTLEKLLQKLMLQPIHLEWEVGAGDDETDAYHKIGYFRHGMLMRI